QIHQSPDKGRDDCRDKKAKREGAGGDASVPAEFAEDRRKQQREGGARIDPDGHRHERNRDKEPAVEELQTEAPAAQDQQTGPVRAIVHASTRLNGVSPRAIRRMFSAISFARASSIPSVQPETWGVISTFGNSWKRRLAGGVRPASRG